jgi:hypothetical protein
MAKVRVYYKGLSDVRRIDADHLKKAHGISVSQDLVWDRLGKGNGGVLDFPRLAINIDAPEELIEVLRNERTFTISEITDDGEVGDDIVTGEVIDEGTVSATLVDGDTGQTDDTNAGKDPSGADAKSKSKKG